MGWRGAGDIWEQGEGGSQRATGGLAAVGRIPLEDGEESWGARKRVRGGEASRRERRPGCIFTKSSVGALEGHNPRELRKNSKA